VTNDLDLPEYAEIERALLCYLYRNGPAEPSHVYGPLADQFGLTSVQRTMQRKDNATPLWNNRVQWARKSLKDKGYLSQELRVWKLSDRGAEIAKTKCP